MVEIPYEKLGRFAGNLATCLEAGVSLEQGLKSSKRSLAATRFGGAIETALLRVRQGASLHEALSTEPAPWPRFYLPILEAGQSTGRMDEALRFLERHCKLLAGPTRAVRNAWLFPLIVMVSGTVIRLSILALLLPWTELFAAVMAAARGYATLGLIAIVLVAPLFRPLVDPLKLALPWLGAAERELAMNRFFQVLAMMYATGGRRVEVMIRFAARCVSNVAVRKDVLQAAAQIEAGESIPEAFASTRYVTPSENEVIAAGDLAGKLERAFERIAFETGESLCSRVELITKFATKFTVSAVVYSIMVLVMRLAIIYVAP